MKAPARRASPICRFATGTTSRAARHEERTLRIREVVLDVDREQGRAVVVGNRHVVTVATARDRRALPAYSAAVARPALRHGVLSTDAYQLTMAQLYLRAGLHERPRALRALLPLLPRLRRPPGRLLRRRRAGPVRRVGDVGPGHAGRRRRAASATGRGAAAGCSTTTFCDWFGTRRLRRAAHRRRARGPRRPPEHADDGRRGPAGGGPAAGDAAAQPAQLRHADRHQGGAGRRGRRTGGRCSSSACAGRPPTGADAASRAADRRRRVVDVEQRRRPTSSGSRRRARTPTRWSSCSSPSATASRARSTPTPRSTPTTRLLLVDTVDTLGSGIPNAIATFERLRRARPRAGRDPPRLRRPGVPRRAGGPRCSTPPASRTR